MLKINQGIKAAIIKIVLLLIFSLYTCSITFFTHTHIINGVTIVHSHFYTTDDNGKPTHEHSGAEIQLINNLSTYFSFALIIIPILLGLKRKVVHYFTIEVDCEYSESEYHRISRLRAPPIL